MRTGRKVQEREVDPMTEQTNIYRHARMAASVKTPRLSSMERAAEELYISAIRLPWTRSLLTWIWWRARSTRATR